MADAKTKTGQHHIRLQLHGGANLCSAAIMVYIYFICKMTNARTCSCFKQESSAHRHHEEIIFPLIASNELSPSSESFCILITSKDGALVTELIEAPQQAVHSAAKPNLLVR